MALALPQGQARLLAAASLAFTAGLAFRWLKARRERRQQGPWLLRRATVLAQEAASGYAEVDVVLGSDGTIQAMGVGGSLPCPAGGGVVDCSNKLLIPGFVNAHTHSTEHLSRGLVPPLPLDLWVLRLLSLTGAAKRRFDSTADAYYYAALFCGVECVMSGCTAVLDHCYVSNVEEAAASCRAYRELGIRVFFAPMLDDDAVMYHNYIPVAADAAARNAAGEKGGLGPDSTFRTDSAPSDAVRCAAAVALWEDCVAKLHKPDEGINIVVGPVTAYSCSEQMLRAAAEVRRKHKLHGHIHLLESRAQKLEALRRFDRWGGSAVRYLEDTGFLNVPGTTTSCAHCCWLETEDMKMCAKAGAAVVHNPMSNLRLGSGVCAVRRCLDLDVNVALGVDGSCSSDGGDMTEALKLAVLVAPLTHVDYRKWLTAREALRCATEGGYAAVGMSETGGKLEVGRVADLTLWDLTALCMLPRGDAVNLLVLGRPSCGPAAAGAALHSVFVRGRRVLSGGLPLGCDLAKLRRVLWQRTVPRVPGAEAQDPALVPGPEVHAAAEKEFRAALCLDGSVPPSAGREAELALTTTWDPAGWCIPCAPTR